MKSQKDNIPCGVHPILKTQNFTCAPYLLLHCGDDGHLLPLGIDNLELLFIISSMIKSLVVKRIWTMIINKSDSILARSTKIKKSDLDPKGLAEPMAFGKNVLQ